MDQRKLGKYIASKRKALGYTQKDISDLLNVGEKTVSKWERGINAPDISILKQLSEVLNISVVDLLSAEDTEKSNENMYNVIGGLIFYNNITKSKYIKILITCVFTIIFIFLLIFMVNNYNNFKVYDIKSSNSNYIVDGMIVYNPGRNIIIINNIDILDKNAGSESEETVKYLSIRIMNNQKVIFTKEYKSDQENKKLSEFLINKSLYLNEPNNKDIIFSKNTKNIDINLEYLTAENIVKKITIPLKLVSTYSNNQFFY